MDTATRLGNLCADAVQRLMEAQCLLRGHDGVFYHAAYARSVDGYDTATFWSPDERGVDRQLADVAEALRDYATAPKVLARELWRRLRNAEERLRQRLGDEAGTRE
jgi:hypothetical protein